MSDEPHYRFPPASAYRLNRCLFALKSDDAFRARFQQDARAAMAELSLDSEDAAAVLRADRDALLARGAHPYLVFMADLRLRMEREPVAFEFF
jgi:putative modified peptide